MLLEIKSEIILIPLSEIELHSKFKIESGIEFKVIIPQFERSNLSK